jgi:ABC-type branched-subunit amino acid transport system substrate-binding protein
MREGKIHPQLVIGNETINEPWLLESLRNAPDLANLQGKLFFSLAWNKDVDRQNISRSIWLENAERFELWEDYFGQIAGRTALNYDATNILLQAIDLARIDGITITDPRKIRESLPAKIRKVIDAANRTEKAPWLTGKITFDKWGNREQKLYGLVEPHFKQDKRDGKLLKITFTNPLD